jgi:DNA-directed RNA polymerase subunit alpha
MENIALPQKISFTKGNEPHRELVTIEPLYMGYGMTLGNSLRRVLLSSLPGAAVVGVKIKGADHEFMPLKGVKEDVLELMLNVKQLRVKILSDEEEVKLELSVKGAKEVTAADIKKDSSIEIQNPELVLANITDANGSFDMEIFIQKGRGYKMVEKGKKENPELGYLEIDSVFSPVSLVSIDVENVRVGKMTNWDKLIIDIKTDGTISPQVAFNDAVNILINQFSALVAETPKEEEENEEIVAVEEKEEIVEVDTDEKKEKKGAKKEKKVKSKK